MKRGRVPFRVDSNFLSRRNKNLLLARGTLFARLVSTIVALRRCYPTKFLCVVHARYTFVCVCASHEISCQCCPLFSKKYRDVRSPNFAVYLPFSRCCYVKQYFQICENTASERVVKATSRYAFEVPSSSTFSTLKKEKFATAFHSGKFRNCKSSEELLGHYRCITLCHEMFFNVREQLSTERGQCD